MKTVNWDNSRIRNLVDHETPFLVLSAPGGFEIRLWWTKGGYYGQQVLSIIYTSSRNPPVYEFTTGCGYNKTHHALESCFRHLGHAPRGFDNTQNLYRYEIGGNFHRVIKKDWLRYS